MRSPTSAAMAYFASRYPSLSLTVCIGLSALIATPMVAQVEVIPDSVVIDEVVSGSPIVSRSPVVSGSQIVASEFISSEVIRETQIIKETPLVVDAAVITETAPVSAEIRPLPPNSLNPKLWNWTAEQQHHDSVVGIAVDRSSATGVVVSVNPKVTKANGFECYILTAYHVVEARESDKSIKIDYRNGKSISDCSVVAHDDRHDIALLRTWAPEGVDAAQMAAQPVSHKMDLEFAGLGGAADLEESMRHFSARATQPTNQNFIYADQTLLPGDSGGPVFNKDKQLVGIISGGWFWWDAGIKSTQGVPVLSTWPARASNLDSILNLIRGNVPELKVARATK